MRKPRRRLGVAAKLGLMLGMTGLVALLFLGFQSSKVFRILDELTLDLEFLARGPRSTADLPIALVLIDSQSTAPYGYQAPLPRELLARIVTKLNAASVGCVGLVVPLDAARDPAGDAALEQALAESAVPVVLAEGALERFARWTSLGTRDVLEGILNKVRFYPLHGPGVDAPVSLAWALRESCFPDPNRSALPHSAEPMLLNFYGSPSGILDRSPTFPVVPASELLTEDFSFLAGKAVLVGAGIPGLSAQFLTPFSTVGNRYKAAYGIELHATALGMLLNNEYLTRPSALAVTPIVWVFLFLVSLLSLLLRPLPASLLVLVANAGWVAAGFVLFVQAGVAIPILGPVAFAVVAYGLAEALMYALERRRSSYLFQMLGRYFSQRVANLMVQEGWAIDLDGADHEVTVFFCDLAGFSKLSEPLAPREVMEVLNEYFHAVTRQLFQRDATIADYVGDAVMAYFGAPIRDPQHAARACEAALASAAEFAALEKRWRARGFPKVGMRIGIHSGAVVIGNIGSATRQDLAIVGDTVNVASMLEQLNKAFRTSIIVSGETLRGLDDRFQTRELCAIGVKGRQQSLVIHELLGLGHEPVSPDRAEMFKRYAQGLDLFRRGEFRTALATFSANISFSQDGASLFMMDLCRKLVGRKLPGAWDGAIEFSSEIVSRERWPDG
ncbi:MAG: adenylate/guanylate cyclase domain-containing protein [SAR324 cluster bacterium]|nr:adenylate/guanylate cyclase domain-containing protein [SAR324 cluster bacterium]